MLSTSCGARSSEGGKGRCEFADWLASVAEVGAGPAVSLRPKGALGCGGAQSLRLAAMAAARSGSLSASVPSSTRPLGGLCALKVAAEG